jgi:branched-chain amino acid transport system permease protein
MITDTLGKRRGSLLDPILDSAFYRWLSKNWIYRYIVYPVGQMLLFVILAAVVLTLVAYLIAVIFPEPRPGIILADQISKQLPGMILSGVSIGFVYAMVALGYTLVYGVLKFINFAHSELFMLGAVSSFFFLSVLNSAGILHDIPPLLLVIVMVLLSGAFSGLIAVLVERIAYRPLRGAPRLVPLITAIGVSFILIDLTRAFAAITINDFNLTFPTRDIPALQTPVQLAFGTTTVNVRVTSIIIVVAAVIMLLFLNYFVNGTKQGRAIRAISQDATTAGLMGIPVNLMISLTFLIGGAFGGFAGALYGLNVGTVTPYIGFIPGLKAFTAAVLGGIGNVTGALLGGIFIGMIEAFLNGTLVYFPALGQRYTDIFTFGVLIAVLIFRPQGLLGEHVDEKV